MKKQLYRLLSVLLVFLMLFSFLPAQFVYADPDDAPEAVTAEQNAGEPVTESEALPETEATAEPVETEAVETEPQEPEEPIEDIVQSYERFLSELRILEGYAQSYAAQNNEDLNELVINFIRTGVERYTTSQWEGLAGKEKTEFVEYVAAQDLEHGTSCSALRNLDNFTLPNGDPVDFGHTFGVLNISYYARNLAPEAALSSADFGGWLGDLVDLLTKSYEVDCSDFEAAVAEIRQNYLGVDLGNDCFDLIDIICDLDAFYLFRQLIASETVLSAVMEPYFNESLNLADRAVYYLNNRFPQLTTIWGVRNTVYSLYSKSLMVSALEALRDLSEYKDQRKACCFAWADYICELAGVTEMGSEDDGIETGEEPEDPDPGADLPSNGFYSVFSSTKSMVAPGVTQTINYANTADDKQFVYYIATVDLNRDDVTIYANYHDNDGSQWGMQTVRGQIEAAERNHADEENYNVVVGVNADFFNMDTGEPNVLVMNGVEYKALQKNLFFGILKDGTPIIGDKQVYQANVDQLRDAVGGNPYLIRNGEIVVNASSEYYTNRAPRTCVGITADNKVVLMVLDGRQEPFSCGGSIQEIAQVMLEAGCETAINLDGGGSSTFVAKQEGEDDISLVNRPSDGYERKVSSSLNVVSYAAISNEFDHATLNPEAEYIVPGAEMSITATGVSTSGNAAVIPEDAVWESDNEAVGTVGQDGSFLALSTGDVTVRLVSGGELLGSTEIHVVIPDVLSFADSEIPVIYGDTVLIPLNASYNGNKVKLSPDGDLVQFTLSDALGGSFSGLYFTAADENCGIRTTDLTAFIQSAPEIKATAKIYFYKPGEASFDFNNATAGDRNLAWNREVSNSNLNQEEMTYYIVDPQQEMEISYVFALDMNALSFPENIADALPVVAQFLGGALDADATAWDMLLLLAERVSPSSTVTVVVNVDPNLELDYSEMMIHCDYFNLTEAVFHEDLNQIVMTCNWIKVNGPIDKGSANPLCIVSGLKARPKADAAWGTDDRLSVVNSGRISYNARVRSSQAFAIASRPSIQEEYGIYPYDNTENLENDKGAQFSSVHAVFTDSFTLNKTDLEGWVRAEDGSMFYYVNNQKLTGVHCVPDQKGTDAEYYYSFGADGVCIGKYSGLLNQNDDLYYIINGEPRYGWRVIDEDYYYFEPDTGRALDGRQRIDGYQYEFEEKKLIDGQWVGKRKMWAGAFLTAQWKQIKGKTYYFNNYGFAEIGCYAIPLGSNTDEYGLYIFGEDRALVERVSGSGVYSYGDQLFYLVNDRVGYLGLIVEYYDFDGNLTDDAFIAEKAVYYYATSRSFELVKDQSYYITKTNGLLPKGTYPFDENGRYEVILRTEPYVKNGIIEENGSLYFYENGEKIYQGLYAEYYDEHEARVNAEDNPYKAVYYYFTSRSFEAVRDKNYYMTKTNGIVPRQTWYFDENCQHIEILREPIIKNGIIEEGGKLYFYENDVKIYRGLYVEYFDEHEVRVNAEDNPYKAVYYYFTSRSFEAVCDANYYMTKTNDLVPRQTWYFDENCQHIVILRDPIIKNGIVEEDGKLYFYENDEKIYQGLYVEYYNESDELVENREEACKAVYYYFTSRSFEAVCDKNYYMTKTNDLVPRQTWYFDENCQHVVILNNG